MNKICVNFTKNLLKFCTCFSENFRNVGLYKAKTKRQSYLTPPLVAPLVESTEIGKWSHHGQKYRTWFQVAPRSKVLFSHTLVENRKSEFLVVGSQNL